MRKKISFILFFLAKGIFYGQISNANIIGVYEVKITEWSCSPSTNYQSGLLYLTLNSGCLVVRDSSYTTGNWFISSIITKVKPDSTIEECTSCCLASGKYFSGDSIHLYIYYYVGTQCAHEYFGKRKMFTGIEDLKLLNSLITVGPVPASEVLQINSPPGTIKLEPVLYDVSGKPATVLFVHEETGWTSSVSEVAPGIYFLCMESSAGTVRKKIVITH